MRVLNVNDRYPRRKDGLCRCGCGRKPDGRRTTWYGEECVDKALTECTPSYARMKVKQRDHGVCAMCGVDTKKVKELFDDIAKEAYRMYNVENKPVSKYSVSLLVRRMMDYRDHADLWDMDHVLPLCKGGKNEMSNLRTLCTPCHRKETRILAGERAKRRREGKIQWGPL